MKDEINKVFKQVLKKFIKEDMRSCGSLVERIDDCKTYKDLKGAFEHHVNDITRQLGYECEECEDKEDEISDLSQNLSFSEEELGKAFVPKTLNDVYMLESFVKNKDKFTVSEFEALLD